MESYFTEHFVMFIVPISPLFTVLLIFGSIKRERIVEENMFLIELTNYE